MRDYLYEDRDARLASYLLHMGVPGFQVEYIVFKIKDDGLFSASIRANFYERIQKYKNLQKNEWEVRICRQDDGDFWVILSMWRSLSSPKRIDRTVGGNDKTVFIYPRLIHAIKSIVDEAKRNFPSEYPITFDGETLRNTKIIDVGEN